MSREETISKGLLAGRTNVAAVARSPRVKTRLLGSLIRSSSSVSVSQVFHHFGRNNIASLGRFML